jgi:CHAT domain-containing protein
VPPVHPSPGEAFVDYFTAGDRLLAVLETADEPPRAFDLDLHPQQVADAVSRLRRGFDGGGFRAGISRDQPFSVPLDDLHRVGNRLLPFRAELARSSVVCFFPHGALHNFPFHAVEDASGTPLIAQTAIAYGFSRRLLAHSRSRSPRPARPTRAVAIGVPAVGETNPGLLTGDGAFLGALGLGVTVLESAETATVDSVLEHIGATDLVHVNCHGLFHANRPLESALLLSNGAEGPRRAHRFDASEGRKHLTARRLFAASGTPGFTAVLRACSSGVTNVRAGDEQEGILRALFAMGASTCLATRWKIDAVSSRELIRAFYEGWLGRKLSKAQAHREAQLALIRHKTFDYYRHPYHWAPFILVGDWR